ncbi:MAG: Cobalamin-binding protein [Dehalococcoidales bacterium]|nr:Cobalamin-binding protein [Dehalococcoidales bacterium]
MKWKGFIVFLALILLAGMLAGCQPQFQPGTYTDDMGRSVNIQKIPQRIVSHVPSITETLFALGLGEKVVGVDDYSDYPEEAKSKQSVGNYFNPSIESIVALEPDLVLTDGHSDSIKQLDNLGINYLVMDPKDMDGIFRNIELLGKVAGIEGRARKLIDDMKKEITGVLDRVKGAPRVRVLHILDATDLSNPWTAGPGSFLDAFITMAGGENIAAKAPAPWVQFSIERIVSADPEIIILPTTHGSASTLPEMLKTNPAWRGITAVKQGRIYTVDADLVDRSGPRIVQGLKEIAKILHPERFR